MRLGRSWSKAPRGMMVMVQSIVTFARIDYGAVKPKRDRCGLFFKRQPYGKRSFAVCCDGELIGTTNIVLVNLLPLVQTGRSPLQMCKVEHPC